VKARGEPFQNLKELVVVEQEIEDDCQGNYAENPLRASWHAVLRSKNNCSNSKDKQTANSGKQEKPEFGARRWPRQRIK
jgi:hypothetical protein